MAAVFSLYARAIFTALDQEREAGKGTSGFFMNAKGEPENGNTKICYWRVK